MKHIDTRYHFVRERIATEEGGVEYVNTKDNVADLLAKAVSADVMETLRPRLGVRVIGEDSCDAISSCDSAQRRRKRKQDQ
ncbi:hypothetical protein PI124_g11418 [Phytophthora idaei]|nr:hypothetical protein PI125_g10942 [Phytophthora idaei]KAG3152950.1 hypothetical protein PI126_g10286 [Phytophthora idaei]KAG3243775.1 hypothetical protein PI124_g11418 [Phytophthora idaei]